MKAYHSSHLLLSVLLLVSGSKSYAQAFKCSSLFIEARQTLSQLKATAKERASQVIAPKFNHPQQELMAAKTWNGVKGPELVQALLPDGIQLIDHALLGANEDGVVKTGTGSMVHLRARIGETGTNIGVNINALKSNLNRDVKSLVRDNADAAIVFIHGGGTKTTGHHVAASLMSWMNVRNVDVISLDLPWHGEGARLSLESVKAYLELVRRFSQEYVAPSGKPVIFMGHSLGGVVADLYMRMYPNDKLFSAVVPLSTVADALPGATAEQKILQEALIAEKNKTNVNIPAAERDLGEWLARQNKLSPTCGMFCQVLMFGLDWTFPKHKGDEYLPALYVIGEGDGLYQGYEQSFAENVAGLSKAQLKVVGQRRDLKDKDGKLMTIGHLIFDHRPRVDFAADLPEATKQSILNGTIKEAEFNQLRQAGQITMAAEYKFEDLSDPETFVMLKNFIGQVIGKPLERSKADNAPLELVAQAYANNLVFREFAKTYVFQHMRATEKTTLLGEQMGKIQQMIRKFAQIKKENNGKLTEEQQQKLDSYNAQFKQISSILAQKGEVGAEDQARYQELQQQLQNLNSALMPQMNNDRKQLRTALAEKKAAMSRAEKLMAEHEKLLTSDRVKQYADAKERAFKLMMEQDEKVRKLTNTYLLASHSNRKFKKGLFENLPAQTTQEFEKFEKVAAFHQSAVHQYEMVLVQEAQRGRLQYTGDVAKKTEVEQAVTEAARSASQLSAEIQLIVERLDESEKQATEYANQAFKIEKEMARLNGSDYFVAEYYTIEQLLSHSLESARQNKEGIASLLQKIWADWQKIWSFRIVEANESLD